ncbi:Hypothetical_protein [Hexamita inflata]|uniref:Hypothetical_protein n=1 Tax=Hexamita inflata TaxID=28002 RepID=A0AA86ULB0_9EUKA|nr:Hypothetical protein HINF_LOCUS50325 [Hexamita inflata]
MKMAETQDDLQNLINQLLVLTSLQPKIQQSTQYPHDLVTDISQYPDQFQNSWNQQTENLVQIPETANMHQHHQHQSSQGKMAEFEDELLHAISAYFKQTFTNLRDAIVFHKKYCYDQGKKIQLNFKAIGQKCGLSEVAARNAFETSKQKHLDSLDHAARKLLLQRIKELWSQSDLTGDHRTQFIKEEIEKEFRFVEQHNLNYKAITNVVNYQLRKLEEKSLKEEQ